MMCTLGALMLWGRVINTSTISTMLSLLAMIISLKNMTAGLVPAILTVSSNSLLSMGLFSTSTKMALISSTVCMAITFVRDFRIAVLCLDPKFWTSLRASATRVSFSSMTELKTKIVEKLTLVAEALNDVQNFGSKQTTAILKSLTN